MVRLKHRYLLVNILYPPDQQQQQISTSNTAAAADANANANADSALTQQLLHIHRPTPDFLSPALLARMVRQGVAELFGDWGMGKCGGAGGGSIHVKYLSHATSTAIIRCPRSSYRLVWSALTYMSSLPPPKDGGSGTGGAKKSSLMQRECVFRVVRVSGTIKKVELEAIRRARREVMRLTARSERGGAEVLESLFGGKTDSVANVDVDMEGEDESDESDEE
ncbi:hypothetical protein AJ80_04958 [Polytolypa hystricis UAMH7299]|uniref:Ribonuclease P/MRP protein subunit POP5 n=1 Tax=Polytolypa hystricis (strain UAMH7299) TaxID=1447883 RepID=A0A2B7Y781_POLH7|nr:hypothetical protein AJ80_04958 [Polytolypa hystricis UAMH7299]